MIVQSMKTFRLKANSRMKQPNQHTTTEDSTKKNHLHQSTGAHIRFGSTSPRDTVPIQTSPPCPASRPEAALDLHVVQDPAAGEISLLMQHHQTETSLGLVLGLLWTSSSPSCKRAGGWLLWDPGGSSRDFGNCFQPA